MRAIAYYRFLPSDTKASAVSTSEQFEGVSAWARTGSHQVVAEFCEDENENGLGPRPALRAAVSACKKQNACLVIASTEPIGRGKPFHPRIVSVPTIKLQRQKDL